MLTNTWLLCFDLDGTLLDSYKEGLNRLLEIARSRRLPVDESVLESLKTHWHEGRHNLISLAWPEEDAHAIGEEWVAKDFADPLPLIPGIIETLEILKEFFVLGILTNRSPTSTLKQTERLAGLFDFIYSAESNFYKPHPKSIEMVFQRCKELDISQGHITYIGDASKTDWELAKNINIQFIGVLSGVSTREEFLEAGLEDRRIINSIADLPKFFEVDRLRQH